MNSRRKNQIFVTLFLVFMLVFTGLMTFYVGPILMSKRNEVAQDKILFKCQKVLNSRLIEVQLRGWERPNMNPEFPVQFAGLDIPPSGEPDDPEVIAWAEAHKLAPAVVSNMGEGTYKTLLAFIRKQNLFLYQEDGSRGTVDLQAESYVHVFVAGSHVNLKLLRSGLALHDPSRPHAYSEQYAEAASEAKRKGAGLWQYLPAQN